MKTTKPTIYMIYGQYGSGKTNVLFKLCYHKFKDNPEQKIVLISANYFTIGQYYICKKYCELLQIPCIAVEQLKQFDYESDTVYFIDFGSSLKFQNYFYDFFNSDKFNFIPILTLPAIMDFSVVDTVLSQFSFITSPQVILTFCDYAPKTRIRDFEKYLIKSKTTVIGFNNSSYLTRGFNLK